MDVDLCATVDELSRKLTRATPPVFVYSLPQNVHIAVASRRKVPPGESYPGFFAPVASALWRLDACLGRLVNVLKDIGRYENSVIIVTADHGDSLGEEGRWGHAYFVHPEVMRIPLIVHVPARLKARLAADTAAVSFSTDIAPSLYALLGYEPADLGSLYGRPLFERRQTDASEHADRRQQTFLLASSYGAVYATLRDNGRSLYVVDAVDGRDYAYDLGTGLLGHRVDTTQNTMKENRQEILRQLSALAAVYQLPVR
jgi:arylsulfatase A-like enzyme